MANDLPHENRRLRRFGSPADVAMATAFFAVPLLASLTNLLSFSEYPFFRVEVAIVAAGIVLISLGIGAFYLFGNLVVQVLLEVSLVALAVDLNSAGRAYPLAAAALALLVRILVRRPLTKPFVFLSTILLVFGLLGLGRHPGSTQKGPATLPPGNPSQPALIHIVLDEHISPAALPPRNAHSFRLENRLIRSYIAMGFRLYGDAYTQNWHTANSVPTILALGQPIPWRFDSTTAFNHSSSPYFTSLQRMGYNISTYGNELISYCGGPPIIKCQRTNIGAVAGLDQPGLPAIDKAEVILLNLLGLSDIIEQTLEYYDTELLQSLHDAGIELPTVYVKVRSNISALKAMNEFKKLNSDLTHAQPGQAYFAHILLPHEPYVFDASCHIKRFAAWKYNGVKTNSRISREDAYFDQLECTALQIRRVIETLEQSPARGRYVMVVHGDHGSRIVDVYATAKASDIPPEALVASYAALFMVKGPQVSPGYVAGPARVTELMRDWVGEQFRVAPTPTTSRPVVVLPNMGTESPRVAEMPRSWTTPPQQALPAPVRP